MNKTIYREPLITVTVIYIQQVNDDGQPQFTVKYGIQSYSSLKLTQDYIVK